MIGHIFVSVFLISMFNIFYYSKFIFFVKIGICFFDEYLNKNKKPVQEAILVFRKTTIFLSVFCSVFGFLFWFDGFFVVFYAIKLFLFGYKDREICVFWNKTP